MWEHDEALSMAVGSIWSRGSSLPKNREGELARDDKVPPVTEMPTITMANLYQKVTFLSVGLKLRSVEVKYVFFEIFSARMTPGSRWERGRVTQFD